jgi:predicted amidohydrolase YtcJ
MYPIKSVLDTGATVAFGSDWSVSTANPFPQIETAVTRESAIDDERELGALFPEERIDLASALAAFTINAAFVSRHETDTGSIETGKLADFIVLDQNLFEIPVADISETSVLLTVFGGRAVHGNFEDI